MKIAYCIPSLHNSGGMERILILKANYLSEKYHHDVTFITTDLKGRKPYFPLSSQVSVHDLDINYCDSESAGILTKIMQRNKLQRMHQKRLASFLMAEKFDVVVSTFCHEVSFLHRIHDGSKKVLEIHFSRYFRNLDAKYNHASFLKRVIISYLNRRDFSVVHHYDRFVSLSNEDAKSWGKLDNLKVIHNPITIEAKQQSTTENHKVIAVGRLCAQKGFDDLIGIWERIPSTIRKDWVLEIYGNGIQKDELLQMIERKGLSDSIKLVPPVKHIEKVLAEGGIFAFSSRYEGWGLACLEAATVGLPVISFDCPCGPKEIVADKETGYLIENRDANLFAKRLEELMLNDALRKQMGDRNRVMVNRRFSVDQIMLQWEQLFNEVMKK